MTAGEQLDLLQRQIPAPDGWWWILVTFDGTLVDRSEDEWVGQRPCLTDGDSAIWCDREDGMDQDNLCECGREDNWAATDEQKKLVRAAFTYFTERHP